MKKTRGQNFLSQFEQYLGSLTDTSQNEIMDYVDSLTEQERFKFLHGGIAKWREFQRGGMIPVEVEGEETVQKPNGNLYEFKGKKHSQGGIDVSLEEGSRIFSEHLKIKPEEASAILGKKVNKKLSYADLSKRFDTTKYSKILNNPNADKYEIETAKMKLAHNNSMLDLIFNAQESSKNKNNKNSYQIGGVVKGDKENPFMSIKGIDNLYYDPYLDRFVVRIPETGDYSHNPNDREVYSKFTPDQKSIKAHKEKYPLKQTIDYKNWVSKPNMITTGQMFTPINEGIDENVVDREMKTLPFLQKRYIAKPDIAQNLKPTPVTIPGKKKKTPDAITTIPEEEIELDVIDNFKPLQKKSLPSSISSISQTKIPDISDSKVTPVTPTKEEKSKWDFGIGSKLANTILDIGLAASDKLKVINPQYRDLRKYPLFNRFVDFDDKEAGRNMALNIQQIQNSNMPEEVKQARIADINAQYRDYTAKIDFANAQRYEQKISQDTEKLQNYINANVDQHYQDIERYNEQKARVDYLKDQFKAQKKARIVNSIKAYANYVDEINMKNQLVSENYAVNPFTGKIKYKGATPDALKKQEQEMAEYAQNSKNQMQLPNGSTFTMLGPGVGLVIDADGKTQVVNFKQ